MFLHYIKLAYRSFWRDKTTFFINLTGLAVGLTCFILILLWIQDEWKYDKFHQHTDRLYQVMMRSNNNANDVVVSQGTPGLLAQTLVEDFPEVEKAVTIANLGNTGIVIHDELRFKARERYVGKDFFELFNFPLVAGEAEQALNGFSHTLISAELANKLFGNAQNAIGKTLEWQRNWAEVSGNYTVAGVFADLPEHSTLQFDVLFSYDLFFKNKPSLKHWYNSDPRTYVSLQTGTDIQAFNTKIEHLIRSKHERNSYSTLFARQFSDRYLFDQFDNGVQSGGRITYVKLFALIALFILLIACINFMNLSTAKASQKLKEIAVKKTIGARRSSLIQQYLSEAIFIAVLGLGVALILTQLFLPTFNIITGKNLVFTFSPLWMGSLLLITLLTGIIAGSYPALYLSQFDPIKIFKGTLNNRFNALWLRKGLVVFQFALSMILIVAVIVVQQQIQFVQSKHLGYDQDNLILLKKEGSIKENMESFLTEMKQIPGISNASTIDGNMTGSYGYTTTLRWEGDQQDENPVRFGVMIVGKNIVETMGMELVGGKSFKDIDHGFIINEKAAEVLGFDDPVGKMVKRRHQDRVIVGVVKDFHFASLHEEIMPCYLTLGTYGNNIIAKIQAGKEQATLAQLEQLFTRFNSGLPFEYEFLDENYRELYAAETRVAALSHYFAGMAIFISCLGLFGLVAFATERRRKEIGIRKVLGASVQHIVTLISKDFLQLVIIAILVATPIAYWGISNWLQDFHYRIPLPWWAFGLAAMLAILISLFTIGFQSIKAAVTPPVQTLRHE